jgi:predicted ATP-grasp superfamily ATP-dependent carboligase
MVVIPSTDEWALAVARLPSALAARFPSSLPSLESLEALIDKGRFAALLGELAVPHPRTVGVGPGGDWADLSDEAFANAFLKPRDSQAFRRRFDRKAFHFETRAEAIALARDARRAGLEVMLQEYVPGPPTRHYMVEGFVDRAGRVAARFVRQRLRMYPPEAEFKYDERDGEFKLLEVNARPWYFIGFAADCGVDFCAMAYRDALGLEVHPVVSYEAGRHCIVGADRFGCWRQFRKGRLGAWAWLRSWIGARQLLFSWDDPVPGFARLLQHLRIVTARTLARIGPRSRPPRQV